MTSKRVLTAPARWLDEAINIVLIGCGGTGSEVYDILCQQHIALKARGGEGLQVVAFDPGYVREPNIVRQRFWPCDIGQNKAICLANRYNLLLGTNWTGLPYEFPMERDKSGKMILNSEFIQVGDIDIIISAVDLPSVRCQLAELDVDRSVIWLDFGNKTDFGQAIIGKIEAKQRKNDRSSPNHPHVIEHYPELKQIPDNPAKSCSAAETLLTQDVLINRSVACAGMNILWQLFKHGASQINGCLVDLKTSKTTPLSYDDFALDVCSAN